jgi:MFS family permease
VKGRSPNYPWYVVGMLWCISFFNYADRQAIFSVFPLLEREMGLSTVQLGLLGSSFAWVYGLMGPFAGVVVDRVRRKSAILTGLHTWSIICAATAVSRNFGQLLAFRAAEGLGETVYYPASMSMIGDYHGLRTRSRAMGLHQTSVYVGTIGGGFFAGGIGQQYGWRWSFVVFGGLGILLGLVLHFLLVEPKRGASEVQAGNVDTAVVSAMPARAALSMVIRTPTVLLLTAAFACSNFVAVVLLSWMPKFVFDKFHLSLAMSGLTATLFVQVASMVGAPVGGYLADRFRLKTRRGRVVVQLAGVVCGAPFVALCGMSSSVTMLLVALTAWGFFKGLYDANIWASLFDVVVPGARGTACGLMNAVAWLLGGGTAPLIIGLIAQRESLGFAIAIASVVYLLAAGFLLIAAIGFIDRDSRRLSAMQGGNSANGERDSESELSPGIKQPRTKGVAVPPKH